MYSYRITVFNSLAWDSDDDDLDDYDLASDDDGEVQTHFPFGKNGEVYVTALLAAEKEGGAIGDYASELLAKIQKQKKQSLENTLNPRSWGRALPRRPGDEENFRRRVDGYFL
jgi:hypothetical protein